MDRTNSLSLRFRLGILILLAVVPMITLTLYTDLEERDLVISNVESDVQQIAQFGATTHEQLIEGKRQLLVSIAANPAVRELSAERNTRYFGDMLKEYPKLANLGVLRLNGESLCSASPVPESAGIAEQGWFLRAIENVDFTMGVGRVGIPSGRATLNFAYPILDEKGAVQAVTFAAMDLDQLNELTGEVQMPEGTELFMVSQGGIILAYLPEPDRLMGQNMGTVPLVKAILNKGSDVTEQRGLDGVARLYAFLPLRSTVETGLYLCIGIPTSAAYAEANRNLLRHITLLGFVTMGALLAVWFGGDIFILKRVAALASAAQRLSGGDMKARSGLTGGGGELDRLAEAFDEMADALERRDERLREAEAKYRVLVERAPVITYTARFDELKSTVFISPQVQSVLGYSPEEWTDDPRFWIDRIHPGDAASVKAALERSLDGKNAFSAEYRIFSKDGKRLWIEDAALPVHDEAVGEGVLLQGVMKDITAHRKAEDALRESEERFRLLVECVNDYAIFMLDRNGCIASWNTGAERMKGYTEAEVIGRHHSLFHGSDDIANGIPEQEIETARTSGWFQADGERVRKDGSSFFAGVIITALRDRNGQLIGFSHITRDLSRQKTAEAQLLQYQKQLRSLASELTLTEERERRRIATDLHDRVGQALAFSKIKLGLIREIVTEGDSAVMVDEVRRMLDTAIQDTRTLTFEISSPILYELGFEAALEWLVEQFQRRHRIEAHYEDDDKPKSLDDDVRILLFRAAGELLVNVAKHAGARRVTVSVKRTGDDYIQVGVKDDGMGFNISEIDPRSGGELGFGLFSIRERLNHADGRIDITSFPGKGTRVVLTAPLRKESPDGNG